jgi:hypothetical protein
VLLGPEAQDVTEIVPGLEAAPASPLVDDALGEPPADTRQPRDLLEARPVEIERLRGRGAGGPDRVIV